MLLVFGEHKDGALKKTTRELLTLARGFGQQVALLVVGEGAGLAAEAGSYGASTLFVAEGTEAYTTEAYAAALAQVIEEQKPTTVFMGATALGRDLAPRVAARLGLALIPEVVGVDGDSYVRPLYAGKAFEKVKPTGAAALVTVRPNQVVASPVEGAGPAAVVSVATAAANVRTQILEFIQTATSSVELTDAEIVVSGGRGLKGPEHFHLIEELAEVLGAAVGASRAVVDAGWRPPEEQVGQTGKVVSPTLYIAVGISGAIQHLAGMGSSKYIVAINKDPEAPIFKVANYGIVGDLFEVVPLLIEELKKAKGA